MVQSIINETPKHLAIYRKVPHPEKLTDPSWASNVEPQDSSKQVHTKLAKSPIQAIEE